MHASRLRTRDRLNPCVWLVAGRGRGCIVEIVGVCRRRVGPGVHMWGSAAGRVWNLGCMSSQTVGAQTMGA